MHVLDSCLISNYILFTAWFRLQFLSFSFINLVFDRNMKFDCVDFNSAEKGKYSIAYRGFYLGSQIYREKSLLVDVLDLC
jgi:hypothetical protein